MANIQIPNLPAAIGVTGDELVEIVQSGASARASISQIIAPFGVSSFNSRIGVVVPASGDYTVADITGLQTALDLKSPIASPTFTGTPAAPTATGGTNTTQLATTEFVTSAISTAGGSYQPLAANLTAISSLAVTDGNFIVGNGSTLVAESGATVRASIDPQLGVFQATGANSVARTLQAKGMDIVNLDDYGGNGNGVADNAAAFTRALAALPAMGGAIKMTAGGYYRIDSTFTPNKSNVTLFSDSPQSCLFYRPDHDMTMISLSSSVGGWEFRDIGLYTDNGGTGGTPVYFIDSDSDDLRIFNIWASNIWCGIRTKGSRAFGKKIYLKNTKSGSGWGVLVDMALKETCHLSDLSMEAGSDCFAGVYIVSGSDIQLMNSGANQAGCPLRVEPDTGQIVASLVLNNWGSDSSSSDGIRLMPTGSGSILRVRMTGCWSASNGGRGFIMNGNVGSVDCVGSKFMLNASDAVYYAGSGGLNMVGCTVAQNGGNGFIAETDAENFTVMGNCLGPGDGLTGNGGWGAIVQAGTSDHYVISGNRTSGNTSGDVSDGGSGANKWVTGNV